MSENEPVRIAESGSDAPAALRALFEAGAADLPSDAELARLAGKLGAALGPAAGAPSVGSGLTLGAKLGIAAAVVVGAAFVVSTFATRSIPDAARDLPASTSRSALPIASLSPSAPPAAVAPLDSAPAPSPSRDTPPAISEAQFLERARSALGKNPALALSLANQHRSRYPSGLLAQEREVIAIEALERLGRTAEAERRSAAFASRYPGSAYLRQLDAGKTR